MFQSWCKQPGITTPAGAPVQCMTFHREVASTHSHLPTQLSEIHRILPCQPLRHQLLPSVLRSSHSACLPEHQAHGRPSTLHRSSRAHQHGRLRAFAPPAEAEASEPSSTASAAHAQDAHTLAVEPASQPSRQQQVCMAAMSALCPTSDVPLLRVLVAPQCRMSRLKCWHCVLTQVAQPFLMLRRPAADCTLTGARAAEL